MFPGLSILENIAVSAMYFLLLCLAVFPFLSWAVSVKSQFRFQLTFIVRVIKRV